MSEIGTFGGGVGQMAPVGMEATTEQLEGVAAQIKGQLETIKGYAESMSQAMKVLTMMCEGLQDLRDQLEAARDQRKALLNQRSAHEAPPGSGMRPQPGDRPVRGDYTTTAAKDAEGNDRAPVMNNDVDPPVQVTTEIDGEQYPLFYDAGALSAATEEWQSVCDHAAEFDRLTGLIEEQDEIIDGLTEKIDDQMGKIKDQGKEIEKLQEKKSKAEDELDAMRQNASEISSDDNEKLEVKQQEVDNIENEIQLEKQQLEEQIKETAALLSNVATSNPSLAPSAIVVMKEISQMASGLGIAMPTKAFDSLEENSKSIHSMSFTPPPSGVGVDIGD